MFRFSIFKSLLFFCSTFVLLSSCEEITNEFGSDLQLDDPIIETLFTDTITVETEIVQFDSINTSTINRLLVGSVKDPILGTYSAQGYVRFVAGNDSINFRDLDDNEPIYDSLVLSMAIDYEYGDTLSSQTLTIEQLAEDIIDSVNYYQFSSLPVKPNSVLGTAMYPEDLDSTNVIKLRLDDTIGQTMLAKGSNGNLFTKAQFEEILKGIKISSDREDGIMLGVNLSDFDNSFFRLYYHYEGDTASTARSFFFFRRFHAIQSDLSGTILENLSPQNPISTHLTNNLCIAQAGTGITTHITFPHLEKFDDFAKELGSSLAIHRVELYLVPDLEKTSSILTPPSSLLLLQADEGGNLHVINPIINEVGSGNITLVYNQSARVYNETGAISNPNALLTSYAARIIELDEGNTGMTLSLNENNATVNRLIFNDNQSLADKKLALRVFYTIVE